jgi:hypothetical protein
VLSERWRPVLLSVLVVVLGVVIYFQLPRAADPAKPVPGGRSAARPAASAPSLATPDVRLKSLEERRAQPGIERDLFRFRAKPAPPPPPRESVAMPPPQAVVPSGPPPPPPLPPIPLRFIGLVDSATTNKIAILSDGRGAPLYGKEGDTVLGQYKILRIGVESIEMAYLDGRGRQTIRLAGS